MRLPGLEPRHRLGAQARRLGHERGQRRADRPARGHQQFERLVEGGGIRAAGVEQRQALANLRREPAAKHPATERARPALHGRPVAADRVDLAVVGDQPEGLSQAPRGMRVGGVALVEERRREREVPIGEVVVERADLTADEQPLVDHGPRGQRGDVEVLEARRLARTTLDRAAGEQQAGPEVQPAPRRPGADDDLLDGRATGEGGGAQDGGIDGNVAPAEGLEAVAAQDLLGQPAGATARRAVRGQEQHPHRDLRGHPAAGCGTPGRGVLGAAAVNRQSQFIEDARAEAVERKRDAGAVTGLGVGCDRATVRQARECLQRQRQDARRGTGLRLCDEADAARVVVEPRVVQRRDGCGRSRRPPAIGAGSDRRPGATSKKRTGAARQRHDVPRPGPGASVPAPRRPRQTWPDGRLVPDALWAERAAGSATRG